MRILAVDDEPNILELLKVFLEAEGHHQVTTAPSGAAALQVIEDADADFECMLLDIQMPEMNGVALTEKIRALPDYAHVPIIMLTAMSQKTYIDKAFSVGATDYVTKPFDFTELRGRLNSASKIAYEYQRACDSTETARRLADEMINIIEPLKPSIDEPLSIDGVERLIGYSAFENFLMTLSRGKLLFATTYAVKIMDFKTIHAELSSKDLRHLLKTAGRIIVEQMPGEGNVASYRGNGVFLCFNQKKSHVSTERRVLALNGALAVERQIQTKLRAFQVNVGQEVTLGAISRSGALGALRRAVDSIEGLTMPVKAIADLSRRVLRGNTRTQEQSNLERRAYEIILQDIVHDERRQVS